LKPFSRIKKKKAIIRIVKISGFTGVFFEAAKGLDTRECGDALLNRVEALPRARMVKKLMGPRGI